MRRLHPLALMLSMHLAFGGVAVPAQAQSTLASSESRQPSESERLGRQYVAAYSAADWDAMVPLMSDDFVFVDRTSPNLADQTIEGRDAALAMFRDFGREGGIIGLFLDFPVVFESHGVVVFSGHVNTLSRAAEPGYGLRWRAEQIIILTVRDGRIIRHEDYANYTAPMIWRERLESGQ